MIQIYVIIKKEFSLWVYVIVVLHIICQLKFTWRQGVYMMKNSTVMHMCNIIMYYYVDGRNVV